MSDSACDFDEPAHGRNWILTRLSPPVTVELCDEHLAPGMIGLLAADLGVEYGGLYGTIEKFLAREAKKAEKDLAAAQAAEAEQASSEPLYAPDDAEALLDDPDTDGHEETGLFHGSGEEAL